MDKASLKMDKGVVKALRILEHLTQAEMPQGVTELAIDLRLSKSSVHRPLTTLLQLGYVTQEASSGLYAASLKLWGIGSAVVDRLDLKRVAAEPMAELAAATGETVHLSILDGYEVVQIDKIECQHPIRAYSPVGGRAPVHCIATGKAMLAFQSEAFIKAATANLTQATKNTVVDRARLLTELKRIRRSGISISRGAWQLGVDGIAVPVRDSACRVVGGLGISGPAIRFRGKQCARFGPLLIAAAATISRALGLDAARGLPHSGKSLKTPGRSKPSLRSFVP